MIDLDETLRPWTTSPAPAWDAAAALALAQRVAAQHNLPVEYEPSDEEWVQVGDQALVSVRYPLALALPDLVGAFGPAVRVVPVSGLDEVELRASADVLKATVLPGPYWSEDFDPDQFSPMDLFLESV